MIALTRRQKAAVIRNGQKDHVLRLLADGEWHSYTEIWNETEYPYWTMQRLVWELEDVRLVKRRPCPIDTRQTEVRITLGGLARLERID